MQMLVPTGKWLSTAQWAPCSPLLKAALLLGRITECGRKFSKQQSNLLVTAEETEAQRVGERFQTCPLC